MHIQLLKHTPKIRFVAMRHIAYVVSAVLVLIGLAAVALQGGLRYGVDFSGGVAVQLQFEKTIDDESIKASLSNLDLPGLSVQQYGDSGKDYLVRFSTPDMTTEAMREVLASSLQVSFPDNAASMVRTEMVGPKVGSDLRNSALEALYYVILLITVYISGRFEQRWLVAGGMAAVLWGGMYLLTLVGLPLAWRVLAALLVTLLLSWRLRLNFALGAIVGLLHDVVITVGLLTLLGKEFDLNIVAALLTLVGYSLNDTIIIYDRIRENLREQGPDSTIELGDIIDLAVNQTLGRTLMTSITTLAAILSLYLLGGGVIHDFALTMLVGVFIGTFSSVFVSSPILLALGSTRMYQKMVKVESYEKPGKDGIV